MRRGLFLLSMISMPLYANDLASELNQFLNESGFASHVTKPHAYQSQASGYYGGGSLYTRVASKRYNLVTLDMPSYRAGCSGIDLYTGSLSYISGDKLTNLGRSIMQNAGAYAVDVMLATTVPELKQVRDFLQTTVQKVNQANIDSCQMAQHFVGGVWPKTLASQQKICHDHRMMGGTSRDYVSARMECSGEAYLKTMQEASLDEQSEVVLGKNLMWDILKKSDFFNPSMQEVMMSLVGTIIISEEGKITQVPSLMDEGDLVHTLIGEGQHEAFIWHCLNEKCLKVERRKIVLSEKEALSGKVKTMLQAINQKIQNDEALTSVEKNFLELTPLPVLKFLMVLNATQYGHVVVDLESYSVLIATDLLERYLSNSLRALHSFSFNTQIPAPLLKTLQEHIETVEKKVAQLEPHINQKMAQKLQLIEQVSKIEKQLAANMKVQ